MGALPPPERNKRDEKDRPEGPQGGDVPGPDRIHRGGAAAAVQPAAAAHRPAGGPGGGGGHLPDRGGQHLHHGAGRPDRHRPHRADARTGLPAADRRGGGLPGRAAGRQLCGAGVGGVHRLCRQRRPAEHGGRRLRPPGAGGGGQQLCPLQPLGQRAAGRKPHPRAVYPADGGTYLSVRPERWGRAGGGHRRRAQAGPADRLRRRPRGAADLEPDHRRGGAHADGLLPRRHPAGGGHPHRAGRGGGLQPLPAQSAGGRAAAAGRGGGQHPPRAGLAVQRAAAGGLRQPRRPLRVGRQRPGPPGLRRGADGGRRG